MFCLSVTLYLDASDMQRSSKADKTTERGLDDDVASNFRLMNSPLDEAIADSDALCTSFVFPDLQAEQQDIHLISSRKTDTKDLTRT